MVSTSQNEELTCRELVDLVTEYLEGALSAAEHERFEAHLAECEYCGIYLEQMQATIRATGALTVDSVPAKAIEDLLRVFAGWKTFFPPR